MLKRPSQPEKHKEAITFHSLGFSLPRSIVWAALASCLTLLAGIGLLALSGWFITATAIAGASAATALAFDVFRPSAGIRLLALGRTASRYAERVWSHDAILSALAAMRERLFRAWATPKSAWALRLEPSRLLFRLTGDLDALESVVLRFALPALAAIPACLLAGMLLGNLTPVIGLMSFLVLIICSAATLLQLMRSSAMLAARRAHHMERMRAATIDLISGQTSLVMAGRQKAHTCGILARENQIGTQDRRLNRADTAAAAALTVLGGLLLAMILLLASHFVAEGRVTAPMAVLCILAVVGVMEPFAPLRRGALEAGRALLGARRLSTVLASESDPVAAPQEAYSARQPGGEMVLRMEGVSAAYPGSKRSAVCDICLGVSRGERVALVGASGAGKSTLLALAIGELPPSQGYVQACRASLLTQNVDLFLDTVRNNLLLANPQANDAQLWSALEAAGLADDLTAMGVGLDTLLGEGGLGLSGGQAKRLAIARMLLQQRELWLLDEPTESLDDDTAAHVLQTLLGEGGERGWLMATHLYREAVLADRVLRVADGRIVEQARKGTPAYLRMINELRGGSGQVLPVRPEYVLASEKLPWN